MRIKTIIILLIMAYLCSGLAFSQYSLSAGKVLQYVASMYKPAHEQHADGVMTFGRELLAGEKSTSKAPQALFLK